MDKESQVGRSRNRLRTSRSAIAVGLIIASLFWLSCHARAEDEKSIKRFTAAIIKLSPDVDPAEAQAVSEAAHRTARKCARDYRVVGPAVFQNFLIHVGAREKGYCFHWARDIGTQLKTLRPKTLDYHWGAAEQGTVGEHNVIVVTARGQNFYTGYLIDGWRNAGRLCWWPVAKDSSYHWKEDLQETAWVRDYGPAEKKAPSVTAALVSKTAKPKAITQPKAPSRVKAPTPEKSQSAAASLEIRG
jgi:hypothetical protein